MEKPTEQQKTALNQIAGDIVDSINEGQSNFDYYKSSFGDEVLRLSCADGKTITIRAVDLIVE